MIWGVILSKKRRQQLRNRAGPSDGVCPIENRQFQYDLDKNLTGLLVQSGGELLAENQYLYDGNGNRTLKRQLGGDTLYHYDPLNQLKKVEYPSYTEELFYDKAGNRTRRIASGVEELYQYDPRNRMTAYTKGGVTTMFQYDHAGNLLADDKARYSYDAFNRTEKVETFDGHIQFNRYDAEGLRYEMEENGNLVRFIFNQNREAVTEEDASGLNRLIRASELIAANSSADSARTYYHYVSDEMGSTTHIVDEAGAVRNRYEYDAWGNITAQEEAVPNRFKFTGQQLDPVTQQYYLRARFYNPVVARFTQEDTYRGDGLNLYAYCANNPVGYVDFTGHTPTCVKQMAEQLMLDGYTKDQAYRYANQVYEKAQIEKDLGKLIKRAQEGTLTRDEYRTLDHYARLLENKNLASVGLTNPIIQAQQNRDAAIKAARDYLSPSQQERRTVASNGIEHTVSGYAPDRIGSTRMEHFREVDVQNSILKESGYNFRTNSSLDHGTPGLAAASHAEKQLYSVNQDIPMGVNRKMCTDCEGYFSYMATVNQKYIYASDPYNNHIFSPIGLHFEIQPS